MDRDVALYLEDIVENIDEVHLVTQGITVQELIADKKTTAAVLRSIEVISEAVEHIPQEIRSKRGDVPWEELAGLRDKCVRGDMGTDYELIWTAIQEEFPSMRPKIESLLIEL
jgi:uncharacterized protein with HEPN domain